MTETWLRITNPDNPPNDAMLSAWIGNKAYKYWQQVTKLIVALYPDVFVPEWIYGGKKHGWSLRYKKSKSFCTLIPEKSRFALLIVFGAQERANLETVKDRLSQHTRRDYDRAATYHDGKWLLLPVDNDQVVEDLKILLAVKRKPLTAECIIK